jgi:hypothetical protein
MYTLKEDEFSIGLSTRQCLVQLANTTFGKHIKEYNGAYNISLHKCTMNMLSKLTIMS